MKKLINLTFSIILAVTFAGCGDTTTDNPYGSDAGDIYGNGNNGGNQGQQDAYDNQQGAYNQNINQPTNFNNLILGEEFDLVPYAYNGLLLKDGRTVTQKIHNYIKDTNGFVEMENDIQVFERNKSNKNIIYSYVNNHIDATERIDNNNITSTSNAQQTTIPRKIHINEKITDEWENDSSRTVCILQDHLASINSVNLANGENVIDVTYQDVLKIHCEFINANGTLKGYKDTYSANGYGKVFSIYQDQYKTQYTVMDKNEITYNPQY